ncbi:MAG: helix-turn-helix transcriptional regulator [Planctomycetota bacterium]|nr:helix-turn-helix transcriptional regulator [Planctomycetota bacterium]MDA0933814.1 helix-turn-helix transcriptional regulator [Planctomycetota bacterium]MDA1221712.1 helix-turn-helix transcriptional regulator [Planctomycetota bacterium]
MARIGAKLYFLRTRERRLSQQQAADGLGIRQATLSHLEQGLSQPNFDLLRKLCEFFDVTPTFLADEERGVRPQTTERWHLRNALVTVGMWIELPADQIEDLGTGQSLCPLRPGMAFYDAEASMVRKRFRRISQAESALADLATERQTEDTALEVEVENELKEHPRRRLRRLSMLD